MSVLIKGMEMPKTCYGCPLGMLSFVSLRMYRHGKFREDYACPLTHKAITSTKRNRFCPLVEVSDGQEEWLDGMNVLYGEEEEPRYCDRNLCATMEINGKGCKDCPAGGDKVTE